MNRIEELFSDLDAGVAALKQVRAGLKRYKASVLKSACEGRLFGELEVGEGELPEGWKWATINEIAETIGGVTKGRRLDDKRTVTLPYLKSPMYKEGDLN